MPNPYQSFKPWRGNKYDKTRLLLLGQSAYSWRDEQGILIHPSIDHPSMIVKEVLSDPGKALDEMLFMKTLSQGLAGEKNPIQKLLHRVWHCVAFTDYVGGTTGEGPETSPKPAMWEAAKRAFRPDILNRLKPRRIIVIGKVMWDQKMPNANRVYRDRGKDVRVYLLEDGSEAMCWVHPIRGPGSGWTQLADTIRCALGGELPC